MARRRPHPSPAARGRRRQRRRVDRHRLARAARRARPRARPPARRCSRPRRELGYRPDRTASLLARRRTHLLGVMLDVTQPLPRRAGRGPARRRRGRRGYDVVLSTVTPHPGRAPSRRDARSTSAARPWCSSARDARTARLAALGEQHPGGRRGPPAAVGHGRRGAQRRRPRRRPRPSTTSSGSVTGTSRSSTGRGDHRHRPRGRATARRCARHGLDDRVRRPGRGRPTEVAGTAAARRCWAATTRPTAVVTFNDRVALGLLDGLLRAGVAVPGRSRSSATTTARSARLAARRPDDGQPGRPQRMAEHAVRRRSSGSTATARRRVRSCSSPTSSYVGARPRRAHGPG